MGGSVLQSRDPLKLEPGFAGGLTCRLKKSRMERYQVSNPIAIWRCLSNPMERDLLLRTLPLDTVTTTES